MTNARFAIVEFCSVDYPGEMIYWGFSAWRKSSSDLLLLDADGATKELARLKASCPHAAARMAIVDVIELRRTNAIFGEAYRSVFAEAGYDDMPKEKRDAVRAGLKAEGTARAHAAVAMSKINQ